MPQTPDKQKTIETEQRQIVSRSNDYLLYATFNTDSIKHVANHSINCLFSYRLPSVEFVFSFSCFQVVVERTLITLRLIKVIKFVATPDTSEDSSRLDPGQVITTFIGSLEYFVYKLLIYYHKSFCVCVIKNLFIYLRLIYVNFH